MTRSPHPVVGRAACAPALLALAAGCGASAGLPAPERPSVSSDRIVIERLGQSRWRATYDLAEPTTSLEFQRPANFYRERAWSVVTDGWALARDGDLQTLRAQPGGQPRETIVVEFDTFTEQLEAEYEFFVTFTDGGTAMYTGHLYARPGDGEILRTIRVGPREGENVVIRGGVHTEQLTWTDEPADGTYIFFGANRPLETDDVIVVFDEGLPMWLREQFDSWLPRLFAVYRDRFGAALPWKPLVLYGHDEADRGGYSYGGGTLTGLIQMTVSGAAWAEPSETGRELALGFLAHEVAHLWNGQLTSSRGTDRWIHEGSADAFADRLLHEFGVVDEAGLRSRRQDALNACFLRLEGRSIKEAPDARVPYECGQIIAFWTESAIAAAGAEGDLFTFWNALIAESLEHDGVYNADRYLEVLGSFGVPAPVRERMRVALDPGGPSPVATIVNGLRAAGVTVDGRGEASADFQFELARRAFGHMMAAACDGRMSFSVGSTFRTFALDGCAPFARPMQVAAVNGRSLGSDGAAVYDAVVEACASGRALELSVAPSDEVGSDANVLVECDRPLDPRPPWYAISAS